MHIAHQIHPKCTICAKWHQIHTLQHASFVLYSVHYLHNTKYTLFLTHQCMQNGQLCTIICTVCILFGPLLVPTLDALYMCTFVYYSVHFAHNTTQFTFFARGQIVHTLNATRNTCLLYSTLLHTMLHTLPNTIQHTLCARIAHMHAYNGQVYIHTVHVASHIAHTSRIRTRRPHRNRTHVYLARNTPQGEINKDDACLLSCLGHVQYVPLLTPIMYRIFVSCCTNRPQ